jgi:hypothetical protein
MEDDCSEIPSPMEYLRRMSAGVETMDLEESKQVLQVVGDRSLKFLSLIMAGPTKIGGRKW